MLILFNSGLAFSKEVSFENKVKLSLSDLKKNYKVHKVEVYNFSTRSFEFYNAFSMKEILNTIYPDKKWRNSPYIKVLTTTGYEPMIEGYKFKERKSYLAFERSDKRPFTTMSGYRDVVSNLGPFYLIWKEDYKDKAAIRRDHWPFMITGFRLQDNPDSKFIPTNADSSNISWGYKNFIKQCVACHSIDGFGSEKDGELISNGKIDSFSDEYLMKFISDPKSVKKNSKMDPFPLKIDLRKKRIGDTIKYLRHVSLKYKNNYRKSKSKSLDKIMDGL